MPSDQTFLPTNIEPLLGGGPPPTSVDDLINHMMTVDPPPMLLPTPEVEDPVGVTMGEDLAIRETADGITFTGRDHRRALLLPIDSPLHRLTHPGARSFASLLLSRPQPENTSARTEAPILQALLWVQVSRTHNRHIIVRDRETIPTDAIRMRWKNDHASVGWVVEDPVSLTLNGLCVQPLVNIRANWHLTRILEHTTYEAVSGLAHFLSKVRM
jgi:hypothetical protein